MKIILAQGNPGAKYSASRHNIGVQLADVLAESQGVNFSEKAKFKAEIAEFISGDDKILIVKPATFYNETGFSARALCDFYKVDCRKDLLILHDDISLPFGTVRTRQKGSDAGNNGLKSIISHLGNEFLRVKIGIANPILDKSPQTDFVLNKFSFEETQKLPQVFEICLGFIGDFLGNKFQNLKKSI